MYFFFNPDKEREVTLKTVACPVGLNLVEVSGFHPQELVHREP